ncbi:hypothetical protein BTVI_47681 [Pitangus sulphuratus]|nr:hypothetical protein BTVI_47681 [Pitangus sulphuratus]
MKVCHVDAHVPKSWATEEHCNNRHVDQSAKIKVSQVDLDSQHKWELFLAWLTHDTLQVIREQMQHTDGLMMEGWTLPRTQVTHNCETCTAIKQAKWIKPLWHGKQWSKYKYGEAWQIDYITLLQTCQGKCDVLTMVETTAGLLEMYPGPHATAQNTILGLENKSCGSMAPQKELSQTMGLISKIAS